ncbi:zinc finger protein AZF1-like [Carex rostrata]
MCKYCRRWFPNGKSLGGHMKSHLSLTYPKGTPGAGTSSPPQKKRKAPLSSSTREEFKCKECGKGFLCWRSYWGHMRWHQLRQNDSNNNIDINENASEDAEINHAAHMLVALSKMKCSCNFFPCANVDQEKFGLEEMERKHECPVCRKIFSTGQALGGHMRAHMPTVPHGAGKTRVLEERPELGFDLNVEPPEDTSQPSDEVVVWEHDAKNVDY